VGEETTVVRVYVDGNGHLRAEWFLCQFDNCRTDFIYAILGSLENAKMRISEMIPCSEIHADGNETDNGKELEDGFDDVNFGEG